MTASASICMTKTPPPLRTATAHIGDSFHAVSVLECGKRGWIWASSAPSTSCQTQSIKFCPEYGHSLPSPCRAGLLLLPLHGTQTFCCTRDCASLALKHIAEVRLLIHYKILHGNKMSLTRHCCAAVDTTEIRNKAESKEGMWITKIHSKAEFRLKHGVPVDTALWEGKQWNSTEICRAGDPTDRSTGWCQLQTRFLPGNGAGARPGQLPRQTSTRAHQPRHLQTVLEVWQGSLNQVDVFNRVCVTFDSHFYSPDTLIQLSCLLEPDCKSSALQRPALLCAA